MIGWITQIIELATGEKLQGADHLTLGWVFWLIPVGICVLAIKLVWEVLKSWAKTKGEAAAKDRSGNSNERGSDQGEVSPFRRLLDWSVPYIHVRLVEWNVLSRPEELDEVSRYLRNLSNAMERDNANYLPMAGHILASTLSTTNDYLITPEGARAETKRIRHLIRFVVDPRQGGDYVGPELALLNTRSRLVRNIVGLLLRSRDPLILLGDPGAGKSMTMREVGRILAQSELRHVYPRVIVFLRLGNLPAMRRIDTDRIHQAIRRELPPSLHAKYEKFVRDKRLIVLFDGMDEMPRRHYGEYVRVLSDFGGAYRAIIKTLFSCRINDFSPDFRHNQLVLQPFNSYQIHKYLAGVLPPVCLIEGAPLSAKSIARRLMSGNLSSQLSNPLMLFLTAQYILAEQSWPESRVVLFFNLVSTNYRKFERDKRRRGHRCLGLTTALVGWSEIAYAIIGRNLGPYINVCDLHQSDEAFRDELIAEGVYCGLLVRDEATVHDVRFSHHRLQEFFAARYLSLVPQQLDWLNLLDDPRWRETILNLAAMSGESAPIRALGEALGQVAIDTCRSTALLESALEEQLAADRVELASRIISEVGRTSPSVVKQLTEPLLNAARNLSERGNPSTQVKILRTFRNIQSLDVLSLIRGPLESHVAWVQNQALIIAAQINTRSLTSFALSMDVASGRLLMRLGVHLKAVTSARGGETTLEFISALIGAVAGVTLSLVLGEILTHWMRHNLSNFTLNLLLGFMATGGVWLFSVRRTVEIELVIISCFLIVHLCDIILGDLLLNDEYSVLLLFVFGAAISYPIAIAAGFSAHFVNLAGYWGSRRFLGLPEKDISLRLIYKAMLEHSICGRSVSKAARYGLGKIDLIILWGIVTPFILVVANADKKSDTEIYTTLKVTVVEVLAALVGLGILTYWIGRYIFGLQLSQVVRFGRKILAPLLIQAARSAASLIGFFVLLGAVLFVVGFVAQWSWDQLPGTMQAFLSEVFDEALAFWNAARNRVEDAWPDLENVGYRWIRIFFDVLPPRTFAILLMVAAAAVMLHLVAGRAFYGLWLRWIASIDTLPRWKEALRRSNEITQGKLLADIDHQHFSISPDEFYVALLEVECDILQKDPALSQYWVLRHQIEAIRAQQRSG